MDDDRLARLTEKQLACLRFVNQHKSSKEIALLLGVSPDAVDQRLKTAVRTLGVTTRYEAALLVAGHEATSQKTVYGLPDVAARLALGRICASPNNRHDEGGGLGEDRADYEPPPPSRPGSSRLPLPMERGRRNDLGLWERFGWTAAIAIGAALTFGLLVMALMALAQITQPTR